MLEKEKSMTSKDLAETNYDDKGLGRQIYTRGGEKGERGEVNISSRRKLQQSSLTA